MPRRRDRLEVEIKGTGPGAGVFDRFTSLSVTLDITAPSEASFEIGDDSSFRSLESTVAHGTQYAIKLNGKRLLTGRVEVNDVPFDIGGGATVRFTIRTKMSDARFASADPKIEVIKNTTLLDFILALYEPLGVTADDFVGLQRTARRLATGKTPGNKEAVRFNRLKIDEARVQPPESIYAAADRHLRRFGLMHWDSPDGKIIIGAPDQNQPAIYRFNSFRENPFGGARNANNVIGATRGQDWSGLPGTVDVFGFGARRDFSRIGISARATEQDVIDAGFHRPVVINAEGIRNQEAAANAANREMSARRKGKDKYDIEVDGLSFWDGRSQVNYYTDTMAHLRTDVAGGDIGLYYVHRVEMTRDASGGDLTMLSTLRRGLWVLTPDIFEGRLSA